MHIDTDRLRLSSPADMQMHRLMLGDGQYPALVIDNFYRDPEHVREVALCLHYVPPPSGGHPGYVASMSLDTEPILEFLYGCFADFYFPSLESLLNRAHPWLFSRCEPPRSRRPRPTPARPHVDNALLGGLVYLNLPDQCRGGTGFYRNVALDTQGVIPKDVVAGRNKQENLDADVVAKMKALGAFEPYLRWRQGREDSYDDYYKQIYAAPGAENDYITESTDAWELTQAVEMKFNRMVLFAGFMLHSMHFRPEWFGTAHEECRLTQNFFLPWPDSPVR